MEKQRPHYRLTAVNDIYRRVGTDPLPIRRKLRPTHPQTGRRFGGAAAFSRYERGVEPPPVALTRLLFLFDRHPALLDELRSAP